MADANSSEFSAVLRGVTLPQAARKLLEKEIRSIVMRELAALDLKGDLTVPPRSEMIKALGPIYGYFLKVQDL